MSAIGKWGRKGVKYILLSLLTYLLFYYFMIARTWRVGTIIFVSSFMINRYTIYVRSIRKESGGLVTRHASREVSRCIIGSFVAKGTGFYTMCIYNKSTIGFSRYFAKRVSFYNGIALDQYFFVSIFFMCACFSNYVFSRYVSTNVFVWFSIVYGSQEFTIQSARGNTSYRVSTLYFRAKYGHNCRLFFKTNAVFRTCHVIYTKEGLYGLLRGLHYTHGQAATNFNSSAATSLRVEGGSGGHGAKVVRLSICRSNSSHSSAQDVQGGFFWT